MANNIDLTPIVPKGLDLEQYFGLWVIEENHFRAQFDRVATMNLLAHVEVHQEAAAAANPAKQKAADKIDSGSQGKIAIVDVQGTLTKRGSSLSEARSYIALRRTLRALAADNEVSGVVLRIDSPGGTLSGLNDVVAEIRRTREKKPVYAFIEDLGASAAYWIASQAERIYANDKTALVGSIGNYIGLYDYSGAAGMQGIRPVLIKSGRLKGAGFEGTEITAEQVAYWQEMVDKAQVEFNAAISTGRRLPMAEVEKLAEGRVWMADEAAEKKLIDGIKSFDDTINELANKVAQSKRSRRMSSETIQPATYQELKAAFPKADAVFLTSQLDANATIEQARNAYQAMLEQRAEAAEAKAAAAEKARAEAATKQTTAAGVEPVGTKNQATGESGGDAIEVFNSLVNAKVNAGMSRGKAISCVVRENPEAHRAYLVAYNHMHGRKA